ncbi:hypothetical protein BDN67DRAFT_992546 [Paxillus ammoniavirescens]|nr:hypothetical protein BDN67DRAFT_992546 [Paxillus ammoniavirescens]
MTPVKTSPPLCPSPLRPTQSPSGSKATLSCSDIQQIYDVIAHTWADSTKETYRLGLLAFHIFCDSKNIPEPECAPTIPSIISAFISTVTGSYSSSAIANYVNTLNDKETDILLKAASSLASPQLKRPPRKPYTVMLVTIRSHLNLMSPLHATIFACLTTVFYATAHVGELTIKTLPSFNPLHHIKPFNMWTEHDCQDNIVTNFHLLRLKSAPDGKDIN